MSSINEWPAPKRVAVQIAANESNVLALDSEGGVWWNNFAEGEKWHRFPDLPQDKPAAPKPSAAVERFVATAERVETSSAPRSARGPRSLPFGSGQMERE